MAPGRRRVVVGIVVAFVVVTGLVLIVVPSWLRSRAEERVRSAGCRGDAPPGAAFFAGLRDEQVVDGFPGYGPSDVVRAEAVLCLGRFAQVCNAAEQLTGPARTRECEPWAEFARYYQRLGGDAADLCTGCPGLTLPP